jgi:hypothetical protein
MGVIK